jgi:fluoride ion exporter CrcB/FEX
MIKRELAKELLLTVVVAAGLALSIWRTYGLFVSGSDPARSPFWRMLSNHADAFTLGMIALLALAILVEWMHYLRTGFFAAFTPFRTIAAIVALALLVWTRWHLT